MIESIKTECLLKSLAIDENLPVYNLSTQLIGDVRITTARYLETIEQHCESVGLSNTAGLASEIRERLKSSDALTNYQWLIDQSVTLRKSFEREAKGYVFLFVRPADAKYFPRQNDPYPFGESVFEAFPSSNFDISEASICMGCGRSTAAVFHLMRVLEIVLGVLGKLFGVTLAHKNWEPVIREIESRIREMHKDSAWKDLPDCKEQQEFFAQAMTYLAMVKDAWRNYTMHARGKYTESESALIYDNVRVFVQKLSTKLSE